MKSVKAVCGIAAALLCLSGCGGSGTAGSASGASPPSGTSGAGSASGTTPSTGSATLSWAAPTQNSNGTALTDLAGYHIYYGTNASSLNQTVDVSSASAVSYTITGLAPGTWYFAVTDYTTSGLESPLSSVGSKTVT